MKAQAQPMLSYRQHLKEELLRRQNRRPAYSLRAYARDLGVSPATLSQVLSGKRHLSRISARKVMDKAAFGPAERSMLLDEITTARFLTPDEVRRESSSLLLQEDEFRVLSDWYYMSILALCQVPGQRADAGAISQSLGITRVEAETALDRLQRMGLIRIEGERLIRTGEPVRSSDGVPSPAIRRYHRQLLEKAQETIDHEPVDRRILSAISIPTRPEKLQYAYHCIRQFKKKMASLLESEDPSDVYTLCVQVFPVTRGNSGEKS